MVKLAVEAIIGGEAVAGVSSLIREAIGQGVTVDEGQDPEEGHGMEVRVLIKGKAAVDTAGRNGMRGESIQHVMPCAIHATQNGIGRQCVENQKLSMR